VSRDVLDLIDGAIEAHGDAMRWSPEPDAVVALELGLTTVSRPPPARPDGRVPYEELTDAEREAIHDWLRLHGIRPEATPVTARFEYDRATREWCVEQHRRRDGKLHVGADGEVERCVVRRLEKAPLPWRSAVDAGVIAHG
jgi:hypothetical protein